MSACGRPLIGDSSFFSEFSVQGEAKKIGKEATVTNYNQLKKGT
jgi:hypothetical protein